MKNKSFGEFIDKKKREAIRQLGLIKEMLERSGLDVENFLHTDDDSYIYCKNPTRNGSFDGVRIYKIGDQLAFRIQKESKTHPYGSAYPLPIEEMFHDLLSDNDDQMKAGKKVIEAVEREIRKFFEKSIHAERDERSKSIEGKDGSGSVLVKSTGTDYSALIMQKS